MPLKTDQLPDLCLKWANGHENAASFLMEWSTIVRRADDIADGDSEDPVGDMARVLYQALVSMPSNPFFQAHHATLSALMANAIMLWEKSEDWRNSENRKTRMFGFVCRENVEQVAYTVALLTGGYEHALSVIEDIQRLSHQSSSETFEEWEAE